MPIGSLRSLFWHPPHFSYGDPPLEAGLGDPRRMESMWLKAPGINSGDSYDFEHNPAYAKPIQADKRVAFTDTIDSNVEFDWGFPSEQDGLVGTTWELRWPYMKKSGDWSLFQQFYETDEDVLWNAKDLRPDTSKVYVVKMLSLTGDDMPENTTHKRDVRMVLAIVEVQA